MPLNLLIKPCSSLCNIRCGYCFYLDECESRNVRSYGFMDEQTLEMTVCRAFEYARGSISFSFQGGEPTLCGTKFYENVLEMQKKYNKKKIAVYNSIQTNGTLINEEWAEFLFKNGFSAGISADGTKEAHDKHRSGTWDAATAAADLLVSHGVSVNILCVVTNENAKAPEKVYNTLKKYKYLQFIPCCDKNAPASGERGAFLTPEAYRSFLNGIFSLYYRDYFSDPVYIRLFDNYVGILGGKTPEMCGALGHCACYGAVEADGSVYPCDFYMTDGYRLGNVKENTFSEMFSSDLAKSFVETSYKVPDDCRTCPYRRVCGGGCRRENGKYCESYRGFFDKNYEKAAELALRTAFLSV